MSLDNQVTIIGGEDTHGSKKESGQKEIMSPPPEVIPVMCCMKGLYHGQYNKGTQGKTLEDHHSKKAQSSGI